MDRTFAIIFCSVLLFGACVQGMSPFGNGRCKCKDGGTDKINLASIAKVELFPATTNCPRAEIIATIKTGVEICLKPNSRKVNKIIFTIKKKRQALKV